MPQNRQRKVREIYYAALDLDTPRERAEFISRECRGDDALREAVAGLLKLHETDGSFLEKPFDGLLREWDDADVFATIDMPPATEQSGSKIGPYKLLQQIGEGGFGVVYMAEQTKPVRRKVALKVIKAGMDSREFIARFEAERQALAVMDHPNIAKVLDAGTTESGRPYFVMELVHGVPITEFCDDNKLTTRERLELFVAVCRAVQHAHQKGIIHRDLKPSNVLITMNDDKPMPKVIDFGISKALSQQLTEKTLFTAYGQMVGTPLYMSPEQAQLSANDVDTRSDVYSLGVLLYELLTGSTPFDKEALQKSGFDEMRRIIREDEPLRPSARVSTLANEHVSTISQCRKIEPQRLALSMQRELDWIVMKALEKDRTRRYESASDLAADIERYLRDEPVAACPPSAAYRVRKFASRNRGVLTAAVLVLLSLAIGLVVSVNLAIRATRSEVAAKSATRDAAQATAELREMLYASDVMLASQDWQQNDVEQARKRLARHIPREGERNLRGFEWHYLWKQHDVSGVEIADTGAAVYDIAISPDGELFAAVGADAKIRVFDVDRGGLRFTIPTQQRESNGVAFSPDSRRLAATGDDGTLRIWDLASQRELVNVRAHEGLAYQVAFSPDGRVVVTCGEDERVRLWDAADGASLGTLNEHEDPIETLAISPEGLVAAGDKRSRVSLWDLARKQAVWNGIEEGGWYDSVSSVVFSDGDYVARGTVGGELEIAETTNRTVTYRRQFANGIQSLAFAPWGLWLAVGDRSGNLLTVPYENGVWHLEATRQWPAHEGRVYCVDVTPDGKRILSGGADGRIMSWDPFAGGARSAVRFAEKCNRVAAVGERQFAVGAVDRVFLCDATGTVLHEFTQAPGDWRVGFAPQSHRLFARSLTRILGWDSASTTETFRWELEPDLGFDGMIAVSPDGRSVFLLIMDSCGDRELGILSVPQGKIVTRLPVSSANCRAVSPDGRWLAFDSDNQISLFDLNRGVVVHKFRGHEGAVGDLCFFNDDRLASVSADRTLKVWSVPDGKLLGSVVAHRTEASRLAVTADGRRIATGGRDRMLRLWDGESLQLLWENPLQTGQVIDLCFTGDDQRLICLCGDHDVVIFDGSPVTNLSHNEPTGPDSTDN